MKGEVSGGILGLSWNLPPTIVPSERSVHATANMTLGSVRSTEMKNQWITECRSMHGSVHVIDKNRLIDKQTNEQFWLTKNSVEFLTSLPTPPERFLPGAEVLWDKGCCPTLVSRIYRLFFDNSNRAVADFLVYDLLFNNIDTFIVYPDDEWHQVFNSNKKALERWKICLDNLKGYVRPVVDFIYLQRYRNEKLEASMETLIREAIEFAVKKITNEGKLEENALKNVTEHLRSIKIAHGYRNASLDPEKIEELYAEQEFDSVLISQLSESFSRILREPKSSESHKFAVSLADLDYFPRENKLSNSFVWFDEP